MIQRIREPPQEVVRPSYLALPIRHSDLLFSMCRSKGQEYRIQQEAAVREKAGAEAICFSKVHCHSGEELGQALKEEGARGRYLSLAQI